MDKDLLRSIGLNKAEIDIYLVLLKSKQLIASEVTKKVEMQRPNVYDALQKLIEKGLVNYVLKSGKKYFQATSPDKLKDYVGGLKNDLEDKEKQVMGLIPDLKKLAPLTKSKISVETYEGKEGMRTVLFDSLRTKKEILGIGINNKKIRELDSIYHKRYENQRNKLNPKSRYLVAKGVEIFKYKNTKVKTLPKNLESPTATYIYGNKVSIWFWYDTPVVIVIDSKEAADSYRSYFEVLWNQST